MKTKKNPVVVVLDRMIEKAKALGYEIECINLNEFDYLRLFKYLKVNKDEGKTEEYQFLIHDNRINFLSNPRRVVGEYKGIPVLQSNGYYAASLSFKSKQALEKDEIKQTQVTVKDETSFIKRLLLKIREITRL